MALLPSELRLAISAAEGQSDLVRRGAAAARVAAGALGIAHKRADVGTSAIAGILSADDLDDAPKLLAKLREASGYLGGLQGNADALGRGMAQINGVLTEDGFVSLASLKAGIDAVIAQLDPPVAPSDPE